MDSRIAAFRDALAAYREAVQPLMYVDEDGEAQRSGTLEELIVAAQAARALGDRIGELVPLAIDLGVDEAGLLTYEGRLRDAAIAAFAFRDVDGQEAAEVAVRQIELRLTRPAEQQSRTPRNRNRLQMQATEKMHKAVRAAWERGERKITSIASEVGCSRDTVRAALKASGLYET
jgi:hypothetical protein